MRRGFTAVVLLAWALVLTGCSEEDTPSPDGQDRPTKTIDVTVEGSDVTPNGDRIAVRVGQPIELVVKADAEGEIHVHSEPEYELPYGEGTTTLTPFTIDKPGIVEVESHELGKTIVQLEVE